MTKHALDFNNNVKIEKILACNGVSFPQDSSTQAKYYHHHPFIYSFNKHLLTLTMNQTLFAALELQW